MDILRGAMMIVYPAYHGIPDWEPAKLILENKWDFVAIPNDTYEVDFF